MIQNGSHNILLNAAEKPVLYKRRSRLILEDNRSLDISRHSSEVNQLNKTDSEKFNEIVEKSSFVAHDNDSLVLQNTECNATHDNISLRRHQLTRVAQWVQNNSTIQNPNSPENISLNEVHFLKDKNSEEDGKKLLLRDQVFQKNEKTFTCEKSNIKAQNISFEVENIDAKIDLSQMDLAQMEYNVKKFLLNQNEWSIPLSELGKSQNVDQKLQVANYQRTETNL